MIYYVIPRKFIPVTMAKQGGLVKEMGIVRMMEIVMEGIHSHACAIMIYGDSNVNFRILL